MEAAIGCSPGNGSPVQAASVTNGPPSVVADLVKVKELEQVIEASADAWADQLNRNGRVSVYGIQFDTGKATIKPVSYSLLDDVAQVLKDHPEVKKVRIEGHTDSKGSAKLNTSLSKARAQAVRKYLVDKGVEAPRLEAAGFGPKKPVADNATAEGREKNRRVEFMITAK